MVVGGLELFLLETNMENPYEPPQIEDGLTDYVDWILFFVSIVFKTVFYPMRVADNFVDSTYHPFFQLFVIVISPILNFFYIIGLIKFIQFFLECIRWQST